MNSNQKNKGEEEKKQTTEEEVKVEEQEEEVEEKTLLLLCLNSRSYQVEVSKEHSWPSHKQYETWAYFYYVLCWLVLGMLLLINEVTG